MDVFDLSSFVTEELDYIRKQGSRIGFVPTMGALHHGHLSLVRRSKADADFTVVSVFVNPTQFNNPEDLKNYPRNPEADNAFLESAFVDLLFSPGEKEIYPDAAAMNSAPDVHLGALETVMEGAHRPGHFRGVVQVVHRLFDIIRPDVAFFGEKDFQQLAVIRAMVQQLQLPIEIVSCPTVRERDGLAMSSRNARLSPEQRAAASVLYKALDDVRDRCHEMPLNALKAKAAQMIEASGHFKVDYLEIADSTNLQSIHAMEDAENVRCFVAATTGDVRLIDNVILKTVIG
jgi:pantoate--beta-alanine ligase